VARTAFLLVVLGWTAATRAADPDWQPIATALLRSEKTGFGGLCGLVVDHDSGDLWINLSDRGMFRSGDQGKTWQRGDEPQPRGRTETPGCWLLDPTGKSRLMVSALVYGSPIAISKDSARTWEFLDAKSSHIDWCAVDWSDPERKFILALKHESGGSLLASHDGGVSFAERGKGFGPGWVFDGKTAVIAEARTRDRPKPGLVRTTDGAESFSPCGEYQPVGSNSAQALPRWHGRMLYWLVEGGLIATADQGATWKMIAPIRDGRYGPIFGKEDGHMLVLVHSGIIESRDGGASWSKPLPPPRELKGTSGLTWLEYDPKHDVIYLMKMGSDLYRLARQ
jgi:hypothetical protein